MFLPAKRGDAALLQLLDCLRDIKAQMAQNCLNGTELTYDAPQGPRPSSAFF